MIKVIRMNDLQKKEFFMKKTFKVLEIIALVAVIGIALIGCATVQEEVYTPGPDEVTKFEGSWINITKEMATIITFNENRILYRNSSDTSKPGTFTFTDTKITFIPAQANTWTGWTQKYILQNDVLTLIDDGKKDHQSGNYQIYIPSSKFEGRWSNTTNGVITTITFIDSFVFYKNSGSIRRPGTFTFTDTKITFIPKEANTWTGWTQDYILQDGILTLIDDGKSSNHASGEFKK